MITVEQRRAWGRQGGLAAAAKRRSGSGPPTLCSRGHKLTDVNLYLYPDRIKWNCRQCQRSRVRKWKKLHPDKVRKWNEAAYQRRKLANHRRLLNQT